MNKHTKKFNRGDTLIEVIFAFAILGTVIGFAFTGVIQARRNAVSAQQRTQALEIAQYQTEGLQTYRNSMQNWDGTTGCPSFIDGSSGSGGCSGNLPAINLANANQTYCVLVQNNVWQLTNATQDCNSLVPNLSLDNGEPVIQIQFAKIGRLQASGITTPTDDSTIQATVRVSWSDPFGHTQTVSNIAILTKQK